MPHTGNVAPMISTGFINTVNDAVSGMATAPDRTGLSILGGNNGLVFHFTDDKVPFNPTVGFVYGGLFQYVRLSPTALAVQPGQLLFYDTTNFAAGTVNNLQVTTLEAQSGDNAVSAAGVCLNSVWTPGNWAFIQVAGYVVGKFRAVLTGVGAVGGVVYAAGAGAGADNGLLDCITGVTASTDSTVSLQIRRFIGTQVQPATNAGKTVVALQLPRMRY